MNITIAGAGKTGVTLAKKLVLEGHNITMIDIKQEPLEVVLERFDVMTLQGNCASMPVLIQSGIKKCELLVALTGADEINLLCCMAAHAANRNIHTIARIRNPEYSSQIYDMRDTFALSLTVNPEKRAAMEIERLLRYPGFLHRETFAKGRVEIVELRIDENSRLCNVPLTNLNNIVKCQVLVCAVSRNGAVSIPRGDFILRDGDHIYVTAAATNLTTLLRNLGIITHKVSKIMLCGGGRVSYYLAKLLERHNIAVQLIEQNKDRCVELSSLLPSTSIICGDASNQLFLESEGIEHSDALVSMTGMDEMNIIISLFGNTCKIPQVITKVDHTDNSALLDSLSLGSVVCPKEICCNSIVKYIRAMQNKSGAALTIHSIADGQAEAMEFRVDATTMHCDEPLKHLTIKKNVLIACITHGSETEIPNGDSSFSIGDTVIVIATSGTTIHQLNDVFSA